MGYGSPNLWVTAKARKYGSLPAARKVWVAPCILAIVWVAPYKRLKGTGSSLHSSQPMGYGKSAKVWVAPCRAKSMGRSLHISYCMGGSLQTLKV